jgi:hypothetical protein
MMLVTYGYGELCVVAAIGKSRSKKLPGVFQFIQSFRHELIHHPGGYSQPTEYAVLIGLKKTIHATTDTHPGNHTI